MMLKRFAGLQKFTFGLWGKSVIGIGALILCSLLIMGFTIYYQGRYLAITQLLETTGQKIETDCTEIQDLLSESKADLKVMEDMPPVQGIIRARDNKGTDPLTKDSLQLWISRLQQIYASFLKNHPQYYQIGFIDEKGNEIMRVDSYGSSARVTPEEALKDRSQDPYFIESMKLKKREIYYSEVSLDREHNRIKVPHTPVFRIATPVYDAGDRVRGVVVIKLYATSVFERVTPESTGFRRYIVNQDGYFLLHPDKSKEFGYDSGSEYTVRDLEPEIAPALKYKDVLVRYHKHDSHVDGFRKIFFDPSNKARYWAIFFNVSDALALNNINSARNTMVLAGMLITVFSILIISTLVSKNILSPVIKLAETAGKMENGDLTVRVAESDVKDEFRTLYRTVNAFAESQQHEIERFEKQLAERTAELSIANARLLEDIAAIRKAEEAMQASESRYRRLFEAAKDGIFLLDAVTGRIIDSNPFMTDLLGYPPEELLGRELWEISPFKDMAANRFAFLELQRKGYVRYEDLPLQTKDGRHIAVEFISNVYQVNEKKVIQCNIRDITQRKLMQEERDRLANEMGLLLESTDEGIYGIDLEGLCTFINKAAAEMLGHEPEELLGKNMHDMIHHSRPDNSPYPVSECPIFQAFKLGQKCLVDTEVLWRRDRSSFPATYSSNPLIKGNTIIGAVVTFRDITERKKTEEELKKLAEDLLRSNQELQHFAYVASHDLQEPLRMISSYVQLLARRYKGNLDADADVFIAYAVDGAKRMQNMITGLLTYARIGTREGELRQVDFEAALYASLENISISIEESGARRDP